MLKDVSAILKEMVTGLLWPINAPLEWVIQNWGPSEWGKAIEFAAVLIAVFVFYVEFQIDRPKDRANRAEEQLARMWGLATDPRPGNSGKIPALEFLNKLDKPLAGISIPGAYLREVDLQKANLSGANLSGANLSDANLSKAILYEANLSKTNLIGADLSRAVLSKANLSKANLSEANLTKAALRYANLKAANLVEANLTEATLTGANLSEAYLNKANLIRANLRV